MDKTVHDLLNKQVNFELFSAYLYFDFSNYYADEDLDGFENWFRVQAKEELDHALLITQYLHNNDEHVVLLPLEKPDPTIHEHIDPLRLSYSHEKQVTSRIHWIYTCAMEQQDYRTMQLLDWFIKEQGEEEKTASEMVSKMKLYGADAKGLYQLNAEYAARVYTAPTLVL